MSRILRSLGRIVAGVIAGIVLVAVFVAVVIRILTAPPAALPFDSARWKQITAYDASDARSRMLEDLKQQHTLIGMSRAEVDALLGPGDTTGHWSNWDRNYWLRNLMIDSMWLVLRFGPDDRIVEFRIVED